MILSLSHSKLWKKRSLLIALLISGLCLGVKFSQAQPLSIPDNLVNFNSSEGEKLFSESNAKQDYFPLSIYFVTQDNLAYCGVASLVMALNAMQIPRPETPEYRNYRIFTQENVFNNSSTQRVLTAETVTRRGMTLEQLGKLLDSYSLKVQVYHASETTLEEFRKLVIANLKAENNFVLVNYLRPEMGQEGGGHISPIAAYHQKSDRFLILDVARYKYPPVWVKAEDLWRGMTRIDPASQKTRGFVILSSN
ncbi:phytochelatin synthase family protein [Planktothrix paucivesiculata]|uniref:glutathione gamma-glutamylcysteinyltransferase n=1 Tax=Planktothrix paucivesiculata PCC 9631 TaxID=671071 RepID=A0A7Z9DVG7_9CYAN|nr:phytochelatin synthase family protein [Planktothrix paucivesiculata]VXD13235.1 Phytochelatin synthase [Planktothrix paucivesiculata PCC 9631]